jgi:polysaccharide biosynthesis transport protein
MNAELLTPRDYLAIARRRKWYFILPALALFSLAVAAALFWPPTYRSEATVLVEQSEIPEALVSTVITDYLERRLDAITRRVMVTDNLLRIIDQYGLYQEERTTSSITEIVDSMREEIGMEILSTDVVDIGSGRSAPSTVAFTLSFDHGDPEIAQRITNELVSLYLNENLRQRRERVTETTEFLRSERERAERRVEEVSRELTAFRQTNAGSLPEQLTYNLEVMGGLEQELRDLDRQAQSLREREAYLAAELALTEPYQLYAAGSRGVLSPTMQLESMRVQLATLQARYGAEHPDVTRLNREVRGLEAMLGVGPSTAGLEREREIARTELDTLRQRYTPDHPDVERAQRALATIDEAIETAANNPQSASGSSGMRPDNPAYIQLDAQLSAVRAELPAVLEQRQRIMEQLERYEELVSRTALVEGDYLHLQRSLEEAILLRDDLIQREHTAQLGQTMEVELKGERFSLIEPPSLPTEPSSPNQTLVVLLGFVLAVGGGLGTVFASHTLDAAVYSAKEISAIVGEAPLAVVPRIVTARDSVQGWSVWLVIALAAVVTIGALAWYVHTNLVPLDTLFYDLQRRIAGAGFAGR